MTGASAAADEIQRLHAQADAMHAEVAALRQELNALRAAHSVADATLLREANEQLLLAALQADSIAEAAVSNFGELARSSQRDALTDTPNRALMRDRLQSALLLAQRERTRAAVLFIDLDDFKRINDTLGHAVGDAVLQLVARRLEASVRQSDTVSRHGGDEFLVLLGKVSSAGDARQVVEKMLATLAEPADVGGHLLRLRASVGVAVYPEDGADADTLIRHADGAMYRAKRGARRRANEPADGRANRRTDSGFAFHSTPAAPGHDLPT